MRHIEINHNSNISQVFVDGVPIPVKRLLVSIKPEEVPVVYLELEGKLALDVIGEVKVK